MVPHYHERFLTLTEAADLLDIHRRALWSWTREGVGPPSERTNLPLLFERTKLRSWERRNRSLILEYRKNQRLKGKRGKTG